MHLDQLISTCYKIINDFGRQVAIAISRDKFKNTSINFTGWVYIKDSVPIIKVNWASTFFPECTYDEYKKSYGPNAVDDFDIIEIISTDRLPVSGSLTKTELKKRGWFDDKIRKLKIYSDYASSYKRNETCRYYSLDEVLNLEKLDEFNPALSAKWQERLIKIMKKNNFEKYKIEYDEDRLTIYGETYEVKNVLKTYGAGKWNCISKEWYVTPSFIEAFKALKNPVDNLIRELKLSEIQLNNKKDF